VKFTRQRYQSGSLSREVRKAGPAVWIFRWRENATEGRVYRKVVVGTIEQFPTKTAAKRAVETFRSTINAVNPAVPVTLRQLVKHYEENELPSKAFSTQRTFQTSLKTWVLPKWGEHRLQTCAQWKWRAGFTACHLRTRQRRRSETPCTSSLPMPAATSGLRRIL